MDRELVENFKELKFEFGNQGGNLDAVLEDVGVRKGEAPLETYISEKDMEKLINRFRVLLGKHL